MYQLAKGLETRNVFKPEKVMEMEALGWKVLGCSFDGLDIFVYDIRQDGILASSYNADLRAGDKVRYVEIYCNGGDLNGFACVSHANGEREIIDMPDSVRKNILMDNVERRGAVVRDAASLIDVVTHFPAAFTSVWNDETEVRTTDCIVDLTTNKIVNITFADDIEDLDVLDREYVTLAVAAFPAFRSDDERATGKSCFVYD